MQKFDGAARFHDLQHGDEALLARRLAEKLLDQLLLLGPTFESLIGNAGPLGLSAGVIDKDLRLFLDEGQEIHAAHLQAAIDPTVEVRVAAEGEMSLENDSIMAAEHGYNRGGEFLCEVRRHGVLLPVGGTSGIAERRVISPAVAAKPR